MELLTAYWSHEELVINGIIMLHLMGALAVGVLIGYERSYHGRAAGIRTYALVCVGSTLLTVVNAYPDMWYGGLVQSPAAADPSRAIQGILTGIGFLGAGVIIKEGFSIRGLTTAASIWLTATVGIIIGLGFYGAAISTAFLSVLLMSGSRLIEPYLPREHTAHVALTFPRNHVPSSKAVQELMAGLGYTVANWNFELTAGGERYGYHLELKSTRPHDPTQLAEALSSIEGLIEFSLAPSRS